MILAPSDAVSVDREHIERSGVIEQSFFRWSGDVRIVDRPLPVEEFMTAR